MPKVPIRSLDDFSIWYTPGVAAVSKMIQRGVELSFEYTNRWNSIAIITDGSRVLGLGKIGPEAALPVMEGKSLIYNSLELTERKIGETRITFLGSGAANIAAVRLLGEAGADPKKMIVVDSKGILHPGREDMDQLLLRNRWKYEVALETNGGRVTGGLEEALNGADVLVAAAAPGPRVVKKREIAGMARRAIVFLLANPVPEMWPGEATAAGAEIVATGRSDFPNQVNNSILFPGIFRGALDVRARTITDGMVIAAAREIARFAKEGGLSQRRIIPTMLDWEVYPRVAATVGVKAQEEGEARRRASKEELGRHAREIIGRSRKMHRVLVEKRIIPPPPPR